MTLSSLLCASLMASAAGGGVLDASSAATRSILAVFAHPDDDIVIGPLISHYAATGVSVRLVVTCSGNGGVSAHAGIPAGEELVRVREGELKQACRAYGIPDPLMLGRKDGSLALMDERQRRKLLEELMEALVTLRPTVVITFGPEGYTGHNDHILVCALVTQILQAWDSEKHDGYSPKGLYYATVPRSRWILAQTLVKEHFLYVEDAWITTVVDASDGIMSAATAQHSYRSQHTPEQMAILSDFYGGSTLGGKVYLRRVFPAANGGVTTRDLFEGLDDRIGAGGN